MPKKPITDRRGTLTETQLQMQVSRSIALEAGALVVMAVDADVANSVVDTGAVELWIVALVLLAGSLSLAVWALRLPGAERTGPVVADMPDQDDPQLDQSLLNDLAADVRANEDTLARKAVLFQRALRLLVFAIVIGLAGRL
jgi:hypothetical protein